MSVRVRLGKETPPRAKQRKFHARHGHTGDGEARRPTGANEANPRLPTAESQQPQLEGKEGRCRIAGGQGSPSWQKMGGSSSGNWCHQGGRWQPGIMPKAERKEEKHLSFSSLPPSNPLSIPPIGQIQQEARRRSGSLSCKSRRTTRLRPVTTLSIKPSFLGLPSGQHCCPGRTGESLGNSHQGCLS